jgi:hypothetical protein
VVRAPCHPLLSGYLLTSLTANNSFLWARFIFPFITVFCILYLNHQAGCCILPGCPHKHLGLEKHTANPANPIARPQHLQVLFIKCPRFSSIIMIVFWAEIYYLSIYLSIYLFILCFPAHLTCVLMPFFKEHFFDIFKNSKGHLGTSQISFLEPSNLYE